LILNENQPTLGERRKVQQAQEKARETYARRRARKAAETLATVDPELWDDHTTALVRRLGSHDPANLSASWVDLALDAAFPTSGIDEDDELAHITPEQTEDIREAMGAELTRMGLMPRPSTATLQQVNDRCQCGIYQGCAKCGRYQPRVHDNGDRPSAAALQATNDAARATLEVLRVRQENGCPDCWQDRGMIHTESCRVAIELRKGASAPAPECGCPPHPIFRHVDACTERGPDEITYHDNGDYRA
jgi:hypothetical protein